MQYKIKFRTGRAHSYVPIRLLGFGFTWTLWLYKMLLQHLLNFILGTCENNYRMVRRRHREAGSSFRKQKQMKCGHLESCTVSVGRAGFCMKLAFFAATVLLTSTAAQMQIVYTALAVWDFVKYWSAALHLYRTYVSFVTFHIHHQ